MNHFLSSRLFFPLRYLAALHRPLSPSFTLEGRWDPARQEPACHGEGHRSLSCSPLLGPWRPSSPRGWACGSGRQRQQRRGPAQRGGPGQAEVSRTARRPLSPAPHPLRRSGALCCPEATTHQGLFARSLGSGPSSQRGRKTQVSASALGLGVPADAESEDQRGSRDWGWGVLRAGLGGSAEASVSLAAQLQRPRLSTTMTVTRSTFPSPSRGSGWSFSFRTQACGGRLGLQGMRADSRSGNPGRPLPSQLRRWLAAHRWLPNRCGQLSSVSFMGLLTGSACNQAQDGLQQPHKRLGSSALQLAAPDPPWAPDVPLRWPHQRPSRPQADVQAFGSAPKALLMGLLPVPGHVPARPALQPSILSREAPYSCRVRHMLLLHLEGLSHLSFFQNSSPPFTTQA